MTPPAKSPQDTRRPLPQNVSAAPVLLHSIPDAAPRLGISRRTLQRHIAEGRIEVVRLGRRTLISETAIRNYIAEHTAKATA